LGANYPICEKSKKAPNKHCLFFKDKTLRLKIQMNQMQHIE
jgi:hypothetical protein